MTEIIVYEIPSQPNRIQQAYIDYALRQEEEARKNQENVRNQRKGSKKTKSVRSTSHIKEGFVYVISSPSFPGWIKVGSTFDLKERLFGYQMYSPYSDYFYSFYKYFPDRLKAEKDIHTLLSEFRGNGEWFALESDQVRLLINQYHNAQNLNK